MNEVNLSVQEHSNTDGWSPSERWYVRFVVRARWPSERLITQLTRQLSGSCRSLLATHCGGKHASFQNAATRSSSFDYVQASRKVLWHHGGAA